MNLKIKISVVLITLLCVCNGLFAQNRSYIKREIQSWGQCKNVALTKKNGNVALYGKNGYVMSDCPNEMLNVMKDLRQKDLLIKDVHVTESGKWLIVFEENGFHGNGLPASLNNKLYEFNNMGEAILSVSFNDKNEWIVITENYYAASNSVIQKWIENAAKQYGQALSTCVTNETRSVVFRNGWVMNGDIDNALLRSLKSASISIYTLKFAGSDWFFADQNGNYQYHM